MINSENGKKDTPEILEAIDIAHLNKGKRVGLAGRDAVKRRRSFLHGLLGAAFFSIPIAGCDVEELIGNKDDEDEEDVEGETCVEHAGCTAQSDSTCTCESDASCECQEHTADCTCESDNGCSCETDGQATTHPKIVDSWPEDGITSEWSFVSMGIGFDQEMDHASVEAALTIEPDPPDAISFWWTEGYAEGEVERLRIKTGGENSSSFFGDPGVTYTANMRGTAKGANGLNLDCDGDGNAYGDTEPLYTWSFTINDPSSCTCESDNSCSSDSCSSDSCSCDTDSCSCESDYSCTCDSFYCSCEYKACPLYGVY
jgi:hypothetical protein